MSAVPTIPAVTSLDPLSLAVGALIGVIIGAIIGFAVASHYSTATDINNRITATQLLSILMFFGYVFFSFQFNRDVDGFICIAILATGYGAKGGQIVEKALEKLDKRKA